MYCRKSPHKNLYNSYVIDFVESTSYFTPVGCDLGKVMLNIPGLIFVVARGLFHVRAGTCKVPTDPKAGTLLHP